jgi:general secretion pathway protein N
LTTFGLAGAASQLPIGLEIMATRTDQPDPTKLVSAYSAKEAVRSTASLPTQGTRLPSSIGLGNPLWAIPLTSLTATRERPIFSPTRRPAPVAASSPPIQSASDGRPPLTLVGAIAGESQGIAIFLDETTKGIIRLKTGESHSGWVLQLVQAREAVMRKEKKTAILALPNPPAK